MGNSPVSTVEMVCNLHLVFLSIKSSGHLDRFGLESGGKQSVRVVLHPATTGASSAPPADTSDVH
ncbi:hypothetical protein IG631_01972 [Alternaria alternata]|nr:hypothetical protein IG631_01972 [Alternaria alternata]